MLSIGGLLIIICNVLKRMTINILIGVWCWRILRRALLIPFVLVVTIITYVNETSLQVYHGYLFQFADD